MYDYSDLNLKQIIVPSHSVPYTEVFPLPFGIDTCQSIFSIYFLWSVLLLYLLRLFEIEIEIQTDLIAVSHMMAVHVFA